MAPTSKTWVEVSTAALRHNARAVRSLLGKDTAFMAVVKSNAYGHGLRGAVQALGRGYCDWFGVDSLPEALEVRRTGSKKPVLILGFTPRRDLAGVVRRGFSQVCYDKDSFAAMAAAGTRRRPAKVHLKIETGTSRQGILADDLGDFLRFAERFRTAVIEGFSTHYANIEDTDDPSYAMEQLGRFKDALATAAAFGVTPRYAHTACSAAVLLHPDTHFSMVRAGIALYGLWPSEGTRRTAGANGAPVSLRPALTWKTIVGQVKRLPAGTPVSYGLTERLSRDSTIAVLPVGYWDGFDRGLSSAGNVLIRGKRAKVLGRVCMNMTVVDVTDIPSVRPEDEAVLLGEQGADRITAEEIAERLGTINYEVVTRINPTLTRIMT